MDREMTELYVHHAAIHYNRGDYRADIYSLRYKCQYTLAA